MTKLSKKNALGVLIIGALIAVGGCANQSRFVWGDYESSLYAYYKKPDSRDRYEAALVKAIAKGEAQNQVAPGLNAELAYLYVERGEMSKARRHFRKEMKLFPESRAFLSSYLAAIDSDPLAQSQSGVKNQ